jgi:hypothetical protein
MRPLQEAAERVQVVEGSPRHTAVAWLPCSTLPTLAVSSAQELSLYSWESSGTAGISSGFAKRPSCRTFLLGLGQPFRTLTPALQGNALFGTMDMPVALQSDDNKPPPQVGEFRCCHYIGQYTHTLRHCAAQALLWCARVVPRLSSMPLHGRTWTALTLCPLQATSCRQR